MDKFYKKISFVCSLGVLLLSQFAVKKAAAQTAFTPGNIVVYRVGDGTAALGSTATVGFLDEYTTSGTLVQTIAVPSSGAARSLTSGSATSEGFVILSADSTYVTTSGYDAAAGTTGIASSTSTAAPRVIDTVGIPGVVGRGASSATFFSANNIRSSVKGTTNDYWSAGQNGYDYMGNTTTPVILNTPNSVNNRIAHIFNGNLYVATGSGTRGIYKFIGTPFTTAIVDSLVFTTGASSSPYDFSVSPDGNTIYVTDDGASLSSLAGIYKYTYSGSAWSAATAISTTATRGLAVDWSTTIPTVYAVTTGGALIKIANGTTTTLVSSATNTAIRGVAFTPMCVTPTLATPGVVSLCPTASVTLNASAYAVSGLSYIWKNGGTTIATTTVPTYNATTPGVYTVTASTGYCSKTASASVTIIDTPISAPVFALGSTSNICQGSSPVTYTATSAHSTGITYALDATTAAFTGNSINASTGVVTYAAGWIGTTVITASAAGCNGPKTAMHTVTVKALPVQPAAFTASTAIVCQGQTNVAYTVPNDATATYAWSFTGTGGTITGTTNSVTANFSSTATSGNIQVTANNTCGVSAPRTIAVTVNTTPTTLVTGGGNTCQGIALTLTASGATTYSWSPNTNLTAVTGASVQATPPTTTTYTVTGTTNGCSSTANATVTIGTTVTGITITPATPSICSGASAKLAALVTGSTTVLSENFNGSISGWTIDNTNTLLATIIPKVQWMQRSDGYLTYSKTFHSLDGSTFYIANADSGGNNTIDERLMSPSFSLANVSTATLTYDGFLDRGAHELNDDIDVSTDGGTTWTVVNSPVSNYNVSPSTTTNFYLVNQSVNLNAYAGQPNVMIRFRYNSTFGYFWAIDNVTVSGTPLVTWSPATAAFTNAALTTPYTAATLTDTLYAAPANSINTATTATYVASVGTCATTGQATITVNPIPSVTITNGGQGVCAGTSTGTITLSSNVTGTTYTWTNSATSIGLAAASAAPVTSIPGFPAANSSTSAITANIIVTPTSVPGCVGATQSTTITVNPIPVVTIIPASATVCNATTGGALAFSSSVTGVTTTYAWTGSASGTGILTSGTASIAAFAAVNTGTAPIINNISVTPTAAGCPGLPVATTITVNPTPVATVTPSQAVCANTPTGVITFTSGITSGAPTTYAWANSNTNTNIAASGTTGPIAPVTATNSGNTTIASTITVTPTSLGCIGAPQTTVVTVYPIPVVNVSPAAQSVCNNQNTTPIIFTSTVTGATTTYAWTNNTTGMGIAASSSGNIGATPAINTGTTPTFDTITVIPTANGCPGLPAKAAVTVNPIPTATILAPAAPQVLCNGTLTGLISFGGSAVAGTVYNWVNNTASINPAGPNSSSGNIAPFTAVNTGVVAVTGTITVTPVAAGCLGSPQSTSITVNPTPNVTPSSLSQALCSGSTTAVVTFTSNVANASYTWVSGNSVIGGPTGTTTGNVNPFQATNNTNAPITDTITVTPNANGCAGPTGKTTITVNPIPAVTATPTSQAVCANTPTSVVFNSLVAGATYAWTNNTPSIGLAATGNSNISFPSANAGTTDVTATISVIPTANGCSGAPQTATITVHPVPTVATVTPAQAVCTGAFTTPVVFTGTVANTAFSWVNNNVTTGLAIGNTGNIPSFTSTNTTNFPNTSVVQVTPVANSCTGLPILVNITVNPYPPAVIAGSANTSSCSNDSVTLAANTAAGYSYQWKVNGAVISNAQNSTYFAHVAGNYTVSITSLGCTTTSNQVAVTIRFVPPTPIFNIGGTLAVCPHDSVTLGTAIATSLPAFTYQWQNGGTDIPGATSATYTSFGAGSYDVKVTNNGCVATSAILATTQNTAPDSETIIAPVTSVCPGGNILLAIDSLGSDTYHWYKNSIPVPSANAGKYVADVAATYSVAITNAAGCTTFSNAQVISTGQSPVPVIKLNGKQLCANGVYGSWQWYLNGTVINGATNTCLDPGVNAGGYTVRVTSAAGCSGDSQPYYFNTGVGTVVAEDVKLYPNPATNIVNISAPETVDITISSMDGKQLIFAEHATIVDISRLPNAVYLIKVYNKEHNVVKIEKLIKTGW